MRASALGAPLLARERSIAELVELTLGAYARFRLNICLVIRSGTLERCSARALLFVQACLSGFPCIVFGGTAFFGRSLELELGRDAGLRGRRCTCFGLGTPFCSLLELLLGSLHLERLVGCILLSRKTRFDFDLRTPLGFLLGASYMQGFGYSLCALCGELCSLAFQGFASLGLLCCARVGFGTLVRGGDTGTVGFDPDLNLTRELCLHFRPV
jgi:hypothetical protein